jgi:hypothetical protein
MRKLNGFQQESLVALLCFDDSINGAKAVRALVDTRHYDPYFREIAKEAVLYLDKYKRPPGEHTLDIIEGLAARNADQREQYTRIYESLIQVKDNINNSFVLAEAKVFCRKQNAKAIVQRVIPLLEKDDDASIDEIETLFANSTKQSIDISDPGLLLNDPQQALAFMHKDVADLIPFGIPEFDRVGVCPARKKYMLVVSKTSTGKSWCAVHLGKTALQYGFSVCHITLEMSADEVAQRYVQALYSVGQREANVETTRFKKDSLGRVSGLLSLKMKRPTLKDDGAYNRLLKKLKPLSRKPKLYIRDFPSGSLTIPRLKAYLDQMEAVQSFRPSLCLAEGSKVLTDRGLVAIENVRGYDRLYDGVNWVEHGGVVYNGVRDVITYAGLSATPDHKVYSEKGWRSFITCARLGLRVAQTGMEGSPVWVGEGLFQGGAGSDGPCTFGEGDQGYLCESVLSKVSQRKVDVMVQPVERLFAGMPNVFATEAFSHLGLFPNAKYAGSLSESRIEGLETLWRAGYKILFQKPFRGSSLGYGKSWAFGGDETLRCRSNRQRWQLRTGEFAAIHSQSELQPYHTEEPSRSNSQIPHVVPGGSIRGGNVALSFEQNKLNTQSGGSALESKTQRVPVYDIINSGPLHRFTVQGLLVHNCLIDYPDLMDHSAANKRGDLEKITVDLRGIAGERNIAVVGFSQVNEKNEGNVIKTGRSSESRAKEHTADIVVSLNQTEIEYKLGLMRLYNSKNRGEIKHTKVLISQALGCGQFVCESAAMADGLYENLLKSEDRETG